MGAVEVAPGRKRPVRRAFFVGVVACGIGVLLTEALYREAGGSRLWAIRLDLMSIALTEYAAWAVAAAALVLAGRRRIFVIPAFPAAVEIVRYVPGRVSLSHVVLGAMLALLVLLPAAVLRLHGAVHNAPKPKWADALVIAALALAAAGTSWFLWAGFPRIGSMDLVFVALFTLGAGVGTRKPLWPWVVLAVPVILSIGPLLAEGFFFLGYEGSFRITTQWAALIARSWLLSDLVVVIVAAMWGPIGGWLRRRSMDGGRQNGHPVSTILTQPPPPI